MEEGGGGAPVLMEGWLEMQIIPRSRRRKLVRSRAKPAGLQS